MSVSRVISLFSVLVIAGQFSYVSPAQAQTIEVPERSFMRLPATSNQVGLQQLTLSAGSSLLVPAKISKLSIENLHMLASSRLSIAPREETFELVIKQARFDDGSLIAARGSHGDIGVPGGSGSNLKISLLAAEIDNLTIDVRGGNGGDGWEGAQGESGRDAACWGRGSNNGGNGSDGGNGHVGGDGGNIEISLADGNWLDVIDFMQQSGIGGKAGIGGQAGEAGHQASCWLYSLKSSNSGVSGKAGRSADSGHQGILRVDVGR